MIKKLFIYTLILLSSISCFAAEHYCDLTLSGDGSGTTGDPWQWSQAENSGNVSAGDTVYLRGTGGAITLTTNSDANGSTGSQITYAQWSGETQAQFTSITIDGTGAPYYEFNGIFIDSGTGEAWVQSFTSSWSGSGGELTFEGCTITGRRSTLFSGGDYYPYYLSNGTAFENFYVMYFRDMVGLSLIINNCTFLHGWRILHFYNNSSCTTTISNNTFDRAGEDFISVGDMDDVLIKENNFSNTYPTSTYYAPWSKTGSATGTWAGHEGEAITEATTGATGLFAGIGSNDKFYYVINDSENIPPDRSATHTWSLDSDPDNIYWTSTGGDNNHNDHIQIQGTCDNTIIESNYFNGKTGSNGQAVKLNEMGEAEITNAVVRNNIIEWDATPSGLLLEDVQTATIVNNLILNNTGNAVITYAGTYTITNNILSNGASSGGSITASYNHFSGADAWGGSNSLTSRDFSDSPSGNNRYFMDYANGDYRPYDIDSPQINAGTTGPDTDFLGVTRPQLGAYDIGPYEWHNPASQYGISDSGISHGGS